MSKDPFRREGECASRSGCSSAGKDGSGCASCAGKVGGANPAAAQDAAIRFSPRDADRKKSSETGPSPFCIPVQAPMRAGARFHNTNLSIKGGSG